MTAQSARRSAFRPVSVRRVGIGLVAACAALLTTSCAAGQVTQTAEQVPAIDGSNGHVGDIQLHAVALKAPSANCYLPGTDVAMTFTVVNRGQDAATLTDISSPRFTGWAMVANADEAGAYTKADTGTGSCAPQSSDSASPSASASAPTPAAPTGGSQSSAPLPTAQQPEIPGGEHLAIGVATGDAAADQPVVLLRGLQGGPLWPGEGIEVTFTFGDGGSTTFRVPVQLTVAPNNSKVPAPSSTETPIE